MYKVRQSLCQMMCIVHRETPCLPMLTIIPSKFQHESKVLQRVPRMWPGSRDHGSFDTSSIGLIVSSTSGFTSPTSLTASCSPTSCFTAPWLTASSLTLSTCLISTVVSSFGVVSSGALKIGAAGFSASACSSLTLPFLSRCFRLQPVKNSLPSSKRGKA
jgi:hypothetical protein